MMHFWDFLCAATSESDNLNLKSASSLLPTVNVVSIDHDSDCCLILTKSFWLLKLNLISAAALFSKMTEEVRKKRKEKNNSRIMLHGVPNK